MSITRKPVAQVLLWLTILGTILSLPSLLLVFQLYQTTEQLFGIGARGIALFDTVATSPLAQLSMIPLLTLVAVYAPAGHRATWFALMASLMNLALVAGGMLTKYLNILFPVNRGDYHNLPHSGRGGHGHRPGGAADGDCHLRPPRAVAAPRCHLPATRRRRQGAGMAALP